MEIGVGAKISFFGERQRPTETQRIAVRVCVCVVVCVWLCVVGCEYAPNDIKKGNQQNEKETSKSADWVFRSVCACVRGPTLDENTHRRVEIKEQNVSQLTVRDNTRKEQD